MLSAWNKKLSFLENAHYIFSSPGPEFRRRKKKYIEMHISENSENRQNLFHSYNEQDSDLRLLSKMSVTNCTIKEVIVNDLVSTYQAPSSPHWKVREIYKTLNNLQHISCQMPSFKENSLCIPSDNLYQSTRRLTMTISFFITTLRMCF